MKLLPLFLYAFTEIGRDDLGNPIKVKRLVTETMGRLSNWTADEINAGGREITKTQRKIITRATRGDCNLAEIAELDGQLYTIISRRDYTRWRLLIATVYGSPQKIPTII